MRYLLLLLMLACLACSKDSDVSGSEPPGTPIDEATLKDWKKEGYEPVWVVECVLETPRSHNSRAFPNAIPALITDRASSKTLANLPPVDVPFGLVLSGAFFGQGDDLKSLAAQKNLRYLGLAGCTVLSDDSLKGLAPLQNLTTLDLSRTGVTGEGLKHLAGLKNLTTVNLSATGIKDAELKGVGALKNIQRLNLRATWVTDDGLKEVAKMESVTHLRLGQPQYSRATPITGAGLKHLATMKKLTSLEVEVFVSRESFTDDPLKELAAFKELTELNLQHDGNIWNQQLKYLLGLQKLTSLTMPRARFMGEGFEEIAQLKNITSMALPGATWNRPYRPAVAFKNLTSLDLSMGTADDATLKELGTLQKLTVLDLHANPRITDTGVKELIGLQNLTTLNLNNTQVTDPGLKSLAKLKNLTTLSLYQTTVTDAGLDELAGLSNLTTLDVGGARVTDAGIAKFSKALPNCEVKHRER